MKNENEIKRAFAMEVIEKLKENKYVIRNGKRLKGSEPQIYPDQIAIDIVQSLLPKEEEVDWSKASNQQKRNECKKYIDNFVMDLAPNLNSGVCFVESFDCIGDHVWMNARTADDKDVTISVYDGTRNKWAEIVEPETLELHPTTPDMQADFKKANPEMRFSEESNKLKESEFQKTAYSDEVKVIKKMIDYIKHGSEIMIPSERLMRINGDHITKKEYGLIMLEILCEELEQKFLPHYTLEQNSRKKAEETIDSFMKSWNSHAPLRKYKEELIAELDKAFKFDPKKLS